MIMITIKVEENNPLTQKIYDELLCNLQIHRLTCPSCGHSACFRIHCYYTRSVKCSEFKLSVTICRVICSFCGKTHAILPSSIVPCSQLPLCDHVDAAAAYLDETPTSKILLRNEQLDHGSLRYSVRQFRKYWEQRIKSCSISLWPADRLVRACFEYFGRQFMQIKCLPNILFVHTT